MKKKNRENKIIDIDLTSMLDVIFIVLMVVMCQQVLGLSKASQEKEDLENMVKVYQVLEEAEEGNFVAYTSLRVDFEDANPKVRHIRLLYGNNPAIKEIEITPETEDSAYEEFVSSTENFLDDNKSIPVMLVIGEDGILYRDHERMEKEIKKLQETHSNLYYVQKE